MVSGYQLKVGGVVVGSWAGSTPNRSNGLHARLNRAAIAAAQDGILGQQVLRYPLSARTRMQVNGRLLRQSNGHQATSLGKTISRNTYGNNKVNRNRNRNRNRKNGKQYLRTEIVTNSMLNRYKTPSFQLTFIQIAKHQNKLPRLVEKSNWLRLTRMTKRSTVKIRAREYSLVFKLFVCAFFGSWQTLNR